MLYGLARVRHLAERECAAGRGEGAHLARRARTGSFIEEKMSSANFDPAAILNRALELATQNLRVEKLLIQLGLDPSNITYEAVFNRLVDVALANINFANMLALTGAMLYVATLMVRTIVPLRVIGIISIVFFIAYGALAGAVATFFLYLLSLPINVIRLRQMLTLVKKARLVRAGRSVDGLAAAVHDAAQIPARAMCCSTRAMSRRRCSSPSPANSW